MIYIYIYIYIYIFFFFLYPAVEVFHASISHQKTIFSCPVIESLTAPGGEAENVGRSAENVQGAAANSIFADANFI